ncbi:MAG: tryptophan 7-halogenase [Gemmatimonadota bacterium]|nr:tryptophan 7-halogenase [Gemmatimonadota bacterium]
MSIERHHVVVIGAGPAGTACAGMLADRGHDVALVTRPEPPAAELAESIPASARRLMDEVGVLDAVDAADFHPNGGNTVWWAGRPERSEPFAEGLRGVHVDRAGLEAVLRARAAERGVRVLADAPVRSVSPLGADGWQAVAGDRTLRASWLVDASGRAGVLARGARTDDRATGTLALIGRWRIEGARDQPDTTHTWIESHADGWVWSVPLTADTRCVTAMLDPRRSETERGPDPGATLETEIVRAPAIAARLTDAVRLGEATACPASLYTTGAFTVERALVAGDAGSFIDPLSSYGVKKAFASGWLAAIAVHTSITDESMWEAAFAYFDAREREVYRRYRALSVPFFEEAAETYGTEFWTARAAAARRAATGEGAGSAIDAGAIDAAPIDPADALAADVDADARVGDLDVREAYEEIRRRPGVQLVPGRTLEKTTRPLVRGDRIVLADHLSSGRLARPVRYVRHVDLVTLVELAPRYDQVPDLFEAYERRATRVELPDFLGALAFAVGKGFLDLPDWRPTRPDVTI